VVRAALRADTAARHLLRDYRVSMAGSPPSHNYAHGYAREQTDEIVEQAKGVLMFVCDIDADAALEVLRRRSRMIHVKVRLLAELFIRDFVALTPHQRLTCGQRATTCCSARMSGFGMTRRVPSP